jgi:hypothetical protein
VVSIDRGRTLFIEVRNVIASVLKVLKTTIPAPTTKVTSCLMHTHQMQLFENVSEFNTITLIFKNTVNHEHNFIYE